MSALTMKKTYLSAKDAAAMIRAALKVAFPGFKFSVRCESFSGGSAVTVRYNDGPHADAVEMIAKQFGCRGGLDQSDCPMYETGDLKITADGELVQYNYSGFVSVVRDFSPAVIEMMNARFEAVMGDEYFPEVGSWRLLTRDEAKASYAYKFAYDIKGDVIA